MHKFFWSTYFPINPLQNSIVIVPYHSTSSLCILNKHILTLVFCSNKKESNYRRRGSLHYDKSLSILPFTFLTIIAFFNFYPVWMLLLGTLRYKITYERKVRLSKAVRERKRGREKWNNLKKIWEYQREKPWIERHRRHNGITFSR